jgi:superfamily II RNA helicase
MRRKAQIEKQVADQASRVVSVLGRFQYWDGRQVTERARFLRRFFHGNALLASELILAGALSKLSPAELAEAASWIEGSGRSGRGRRIPSLPGHLHSVHRTVTATDRKVRRAEQDNLIDISTGLGPMENLGLIYRAMLGDSLTELCADYGLDPGDLYGRLTETRMWLRQLEGALMSSGLDPQLLETSKAARVVLSERAGTVGFTPATEGLL